MSTDHASLLTSTDHDLPCRFRIASFPTRQAGNPGIELFYQGLKSHGIFLDRELVYESAWLKKNADDIDAIHVHWPEKFWNGRLHGRLDRWIRMATAGRIRGVLRMQQCLKIAKQLGLTRLWTVHNVEPHEGADWIDLWGYRVVADNADIVISYSHAAVEEIRSQYRPRGPIVAMHHGNYSGMYPQPRSRESVAQDLGLDPSLPIVSCVGIIRPYKGIDVAISAANQLEGQVQFVISGQLHDSMNAVEIKKAAEELPNVVYEPRLLTDQEFADRLGFCDLVLLPFRKITGSGSLLAAWTFGRGVIASNLPLLREMLEPEPDAGRLFSVGDGAACAAAITQYLKEVPSAQRQAAAERITREHSWEKCVEPVAAAILS